MTTQPPRPTDPPPPGTRWEAQTMLTTFGHQTRWIAVPADPPRRHP